MNYKGAVERGKGREGKCFGDVKRQNPLIGRNRRKKDIDSNTSGKTTLQDGLTAVCRSVQPSEDTVLKICFFRSHTSEVRTVQYRERNSTCRDYSNFLYLRLLVQFNRLQQANASMHTSSTIPAINRTLAVAARRI